MSSKYQISPLAPAFFPRLPEVGGVRLSTAACGVKSRGRADVLLGEFDLNTSIAGVLTRSKTRSASVDWCRKNLPYGRAQALLVNSGNANAFTGSKGADTVEAIVTSVAETLACRPSRVFTASTGIIGEPLHAEIITSSLDHLNQRLSGTNDPEIWKAAASSIMTTDTFPKGASAQTTIKGVDVNIAGIAKGSGMIAPNMATMLSFIFTDAKIDFKALQNLISDVNVRTFNCITVDSDTSTSDTVLVFATGAADHNLIERADDPALREFNIALEDVSRDLAQQIVRDGEGATKFITIKVTEAEDNHSARKIGHSIANSPLVKTAIAGEDPNWGRIVMAIGKSGEAADRDKIGIRIGGIEIASHGQAIDRYEEGPVAKHMRGDEINIEVSVGIGSGVGTVWTCDLTQRYITINADYRS